MYHSITFGTMNTWDDWHLVPSARPVFNPPTLKKKTLEISGGNGLIDVSESLTGYPLYNNREGSIEFIVMNDYKSWEEAYSDIMDYLHGQSMKVFLEDDPEYCYEGRFTVNNWKSDSKWSLITIDYSLAPYKTKIETTKSDILFATTTNKNYIFNSDFYGRAPVCPVFDVETTSNLGVNIAFINPQLGLRETKKLYNGKTQVPEFVFYGTSVTIYIQAVGSSLYLEDSDSEVILDSSGNEITTVVSGNVTISCNQGRL